MPKLNEICRYIRSKNAGPFWITVDLFFKDRGSFDLYARSETLSAGRLAGIFGVPEDSVKWFAVPDLNVVKFSYPRTAPQGGMIERDMHGGQQFARLLEIMA